MTEQKTGVLQANGKDYRLSYSVNAICDMEESVTGFNIHEFAADPKKISVGTMRTLIWGGLRDHHPEIDLLAAGEIMSAVGIERAIAAAVQALTRDAPTTAGVH